MKDRICTECDVIFTPHQYNQKRCVICIEKLDPRYDASRLIKVCKGFGVTFKRMSPMQYYCSPECAKDNLYLLNNYGITRKDFNMMLSDQKSLCYICGTKGFKLHKNARSNLVVDHNHTTGEIRGLLCHNCNRGLGLFQEDVNFLSKAIEYLSERATTIPNGSTPKQVEAQGKGKKK